MNIGTNRDHARAIAQATIRNSNLGTLEDRLTEALLLAYEDALRVSHDATVRIGPYAMRELRANTPADMITPEQWEQVEQFVTVTLGAAARMIRSLLDDDTPPAGGLYEPGPLPDEPAAPEAPVETLPFTPQPEAPQKRSRRRKS